MKALIGSLGLAYVAHSATLTDLILPTLAAVVAAEVAWVVHLARKRSAR